MKFGVHRVGLSELLEVLEGDKRQVERGIADFFQTRRVFHREDGFGNGFQP